MDVQEKPRVPKAQYNRWRSKKGSELKDDVNSRATKGTNFHPRDQKGCAMETEEEKNRAPEAAHCKDHVGEPIKHSHTDHETSQNARQMSLLMETMECVLVFLFFYYFIRP